MQESALPANGQRVAFEIVAGAFAQDEIALLADQRLDVGSMQTIVVVAETLDVLHHFLLLLK